MEGSKEEKQISNLKKQKEEEIEIEEERASTETLRKFFFSLESSLIIQNPQRNKKLQVKACFSSSVFF
mgnify:CR=1 FL=1